MRCAYCFRHLSERPIIAKREIVLKICAYISAYCKIHSINNFSIQPWGGEPLLAAELIFEIQDYFQKQNQHPFITLETNATLLNEEITEELYRRRIQVGVSIDGCAAVHDRQRMLANGQGSLESVVKGIKLLQNAGYGDSLAAISVATKRSLGHIEETLHFLAKEIGLPSVKMNLVRASTQTKDLAVGIEYVEEYVDRLLAGLAALHRDGVSFTEGNVLEKLSNLLLRRNRNICISRGCMGGRSMVSFDCEGNIYPCEMTDYPEEALGNVFDNADLVQAVQKAATQKAYFQERKCEQCDDCPWLYYCGGGCASAVKYRTGAFDGIDEIECKVNRVLYPKLVKMILDEPELAEKMVGHMTTIRWR